MTTFIISPDGVFVLDPEKGWRPANDGEYFEADGGNYLQLNAEGYFTGLLQGIAAGVLAALFALGVVAVLVVS